MRKIAPRQALHQCLQAKPQSTLDDSESRDEVAWL